MAYQFFINNLPLPITPGAMTVKMPSMNKTINLVNEGEINIPKNMGLFEISFDFLLPQGQTYPFTQHTVLKGGFNFSISSPYIDKAIDYATGLAMKGVGMVTGAVSSGASWVAGAVSDAVSPASMSRRGVGDVIGGVGAEIGGENWGASLVSDLNGAYGGGLTTPFGNIGFSYTPDMELNAKNVLTLINSWRLMKVPVRLIVSRVSPTGKYLSDLNLPVLIEDITTNEDAEEYGMDVMCSISFKEYKEYGTKSVKLNEVKNSDGSTTKTASQTKTRSTSGKTVKSSVKTQNGDTLANIAKKETGSFDNYVAVAKANDVAVPEIDNTISEIAGTNGINYDYISTPLDDILDPTSSLGDEPLGNFVETPVKLTTFTPSNTLKPINMDYLNMQDAFTQYLDSTSPLNDIEVPSTVTIPVQMRDDVMSPGLIGNSNMLPNLRGGM